MKNIFLLPTDEPSRLYLNMKGILSKDELKMRLKNQNINITSLEKIKKGDWFLDLTDNTLWKNETPESMGRILFPECKKIIITTDPTLIADGVQAIDDTFLEWFFKNPSCEFVKIEIENYSQDEFIDDDYGGEIYSFEYQRYQIVIPQEEPKQIYYNTVGRENGEFVIKGQFNTQEEALDLANELNKKFPDLYYDWKETLIKVEPKQETLEEVAKNYGAGFGRLDDEISFLAGANWQAERMFSEEDMLEFGKYLLELANSAMSRKCNMGMLDLETGTKLTKDLFERFKKK